MDKTKYCLKTIDGEVVTVDGDKQTLRADDVQNGNEQRVHIEEKTIQNTLCMAFKFLHDGNKYVLKAKDTELQLEEQGSEGPVTLSDHCWFEKYDIKDGNHYGLRSVVEPKQYICVQHDNDGELLCLSLTNERLVHVTHEEIS